MFLMSTWWMTSSIMHSCNAWDFTGFCGLWGWSWMSHSHQFLEYPVEYHSSLWWSLQRSCVSADRQLIISLRIDTHISNILTKANTSLGFIRRNLGRCPTNIKRQVYLSLVRPHLEYDKLHCPSLYHLAFLFGICVFVGADPIHYWHTQGAVLQGWGRLVAWYLWDICLNFAV
jgi:hypothetical protein